MDTCEDDSCTGCSSDDSETYSGASQPEVASFDQDLECMASSKDWGNSPCCGCDCLVACLGDNEGMLNLVD